MNFTDRIANLLTGGKYITAMFSHQLLHSAALPKAWAYEDALERIAAMETPGANATVARMAREARAALDADHSAPVPPLQRRKPLEF